jgi:hypothetical protein
MGHLMDIGVGYYGSKGTRIIADTLWKTFKHLKREEVSPLKGILYQSGD